ncbi:hypothetical protein BDQ12DRAFT_729429 [Crucibulum laeve]|uniref:DUF6534 domain-containing protein n=1 Tax=Crucibulum laeve TaxID=68775 RepID=A0A5C3LG39_9AGAR|nr:hypothetical protein BDQ12DRAFT_729429 [Crucibulum laeve]
MAPLLDIESTFGAIFIGAFVSSILYGIATNQVYRYYLMYPSDSTNMKVMVGVIWFFDMYVLYGVAIERAADMPISTAVAVISSRITSLLGFETYSWLLMCALATDAVTDAVLAATLTYLLKQRQQRNGYNNSLVEKLMMYAVSTGAITSLTAIGSVVAIALKPNDFIDMGIFLVFKKLYPNTLLVWLNLRKPAPESTRVYQLRDLSSGSSGSSHNPQSTIIDPKKHMVRMSIFQLMGFPHSSFGTESPGRIRYQY